MEKKQTNRFCPPWWLRNPHIQSCLNTVIRPSFKEIIEWEQLELPDGDFVDLCWAGKPGNPIVILLHGLEGSVRSPYIQFMLNALVEDNKRVVVMHFRGCSGRPNRLSRSYHASDYHDLAALVTILKERYPKVPLRAVGFSMGGNVLLHYLHLHPKAPIESAVVVSIPFELDKCIDHLPFFYARNLLRTMKRKMTDKIKSGYAMPVSMNDLKSVKHFREFDNYITAPMNGFENAQDYYERSTVRHFLKDIQQKLLIIHAKDDPLIPALSVPSIKELSPTTLFDLFESGGHMGFLHGQYPWKVEYWLQDRILDFLDKSV